MVIEEDRSGAKSRTANGIANSHPDLEWRETVQGRRPGDRFVRVATHKGFTRVRRGYLVPRPGTGDPTAGIGHVLHVVKRALLGTPIPTAREAHERLNKIRALAVFSSDALSSVAYAGEEIMKVLVVAGAAALSLTLPIAAVIVLLLAIVVLSYRQTIRAYPSGGGSYIVANDNLGMIPGLTAAGALLIDYVLTVSVSVAAGVAAITSHGARLAAVRSADVRGSGRADHARQPQRHPRIGDHLRRADLCVRDHDVRAHRRRRLAARHRRLQLHAAAVGQAFRRRRAWASS